MPFTKEQEKAIYTRNKNLLVSAAAGSGKTTVLVERIIQTILNEKNNVNIDNLLVTTFTRNAAMEMKNRIYSVINEKLIENPNNSHLKAQLYLLDKSYITTIDSFCLSVVKKNFKILNIEPNFKIGDSAEIEILKIEALNDFLENLYEEENQELLSVLNAYSSKADDTDFLEKFLLVYNKIQNIDYPKKWLKEMAETFNIANEDELFNSELFKLAINEIKINLTTANDIISKIENIFSKVLGSDYKKPKFLIEDINTCQELISSLNNKKYSYFFEKINSLKLERLNLNGLKGHDEEKNQVKFLRNSFKEIIEGIPKKDFPYTLKQMLRQNKKFYPIFKNFCNLLIDFDNYFMEIKKNKKTFTFNDILHFCLEILLDENLTPTKVALEYKEKFKEVIIDEYQDINSIQELILSAICNENNRFMVGDMKQCIYKFRNSNPKIFIEKYNIKNDELNERIDLNQNFRSNKNVVDAINFIFEQIMDKDLGEVNYDENSKLHFSANFEDLNNENKNISEKCEFYLIDNNIEKENEAVDDTLEEIKELEEIELEANLIVKRIKKLMEEDNFKVFNRNTKKYEPLDYKDIVILLRNTKTSADVFTKILNENKIPAFTKTSSGFFDFIEVSVVINILKIIDNPMQDLPLISVLHSPIFHFTADELLEIKLLSSNKIYYNEILNYINSKEEDVNLELKNKLEKFINKLKNWQKLSTILTISELISFLYEDTNYYNYIGLLTKGKTRQANLLSLLEKAIDFEKTNIQGIFNFITYVDKIKKGASEGDASILSEDENLVRIMSIHKSKGLEFPIVFVAMLGKKFNESDLTSKILIHNEYGIGATFIDNFSESLENLEMMVNSEDEEDSEDLNYPTFSARLEYDTFQKNIIKSKIKSEKLSEEMRVLYVALTRAKEKLILIGSCKDVKKQKEKWENLSLNKNFIKTNTNSFLDWIGIVLQNENSFWESKIICKGDITSNDNGVITSKIINFDFIEDINTSTDYSNEKVSINEKLNWVYPNMLEQNLKSKNTISEIKRNYQKEVLGLESFDDLYLNLNLPEFYKKKSSKISPLKKGTIYHTLLEHLDFNISSLNELEKLITSLKENNILKEDEINVIDKTKILDFLSSDLSKRIKNSNLVKREQPFVIGLSPFEVYNNKKYENLSSTILVNGIIDLYFEENNELVLVDYKTDKLKSKKSILDKYYIQLSIYKKALEQSTGKKVKETILCMISENKYINI